MILQSLTDWRELERLLATQDSAGRRSINEAAMTQALEARVKGQNHVIADLVRFIRLQWAKQARRRPVANLLFLGPTGSGKTEMAKAMAEFLYGDERNMLRFDCSELAGDESKNHLIGNPRGYSGDSEGGKLTRPVINNPRRVVLFDEVEKAWPPVMDLFLQMLGEGRLTEPASGQVADFCQSVIILTSNAQSDAILRLGTEISDPDELLNAVKCHLSSCGAFRPEIIGRIDRVCIFRPLEGMVVAEIAVLKICNAAREYGLELGFVDPHLVFDAMRRGNKLSRFGVRELERVVNDMLGDHFLAASEAGYRRIQLSLGESGTLTVQPASRE